MENGSLEQALRAVGINCYLATVAQALGQGAHYEDLLHLIPKQSSDGCHEYIADIHRVIVAFRPESAHRWLELVVTAITEQETCASEHGFWFGSLLGFAQAGVWLDERGYGKRDDLPLTCFQRELLQQIARVTCCGIKMWRPGHDVINHIPELVKGDFFGQLKVFMFGLNPNLVSLETVLDRKQRVARMFDYIACNGREEKLGIPGQFLLKRLLHSYIDQTPNVLHVADACLKV